MTVGDKIKQRPAARRRNHLRMATQVRPAAKARSPKAGPFGDDWQSFVEEVSAKIQQAINMSALGKVTPYDEPYAVLKRSAYEFAFRWRGKVKARHIKTAIESYRHEQECRKNCSLQRNLRGFKVTFKDNAFHWILTGIAAGLQIGEFEIKKDLITRFAQQLKYADRHKVPPEFLIGFLYQSGTIMEVCNKFKDSDRREPWFIAQKVKSGPDLSDI